MSYEKIPQANIAQAVKIIRTKVAGTISDSVMDLLYYERKEDEEFPVGALEYLVKRGYVTPKQIVSKFSRELGDMQPNENIPPVFEIFTVTNGETILVGIAEGATFREACKNCIKYNEELCSDSGLLYDEEKNTIGGSPLFYVDHGKVKME